jgi:hypothetical protein
VLAGAQDGNPPVAAPRPPGRSAASARRTARSPTGSQLRNICWKSLVRAHENGMCERWLRPRADSSS